MKLRGRDWVVTLAPTFPPYHVQGFNPKSLSRLIERAGFKLNSLEIAGEISPQTGKLTLQKNIEFQAAKFANWVGKAIGKGMYLNIWAQKK
jgi:hypothetical protein